MLPAKPHLRLRRDGSATVEYRVSRAEITKSAVPRGFSQFEPGNWQTIFDSAHFNERHFQQDLHISNDRALANWAVFACQTLIAADLGKLTPMLMVWNDRDKLFEEVSSPAVTPVLTKPNPYQTWPQFIRSWSFSKTSRGNAFILKERDARNVVVGLRVLEPDRVQTLVSDGGAVFYRLNYDRLTLPDETSIVVPASEIIHDRMWCLFHPLIGLPPLFASWLAAQHGLTMQEQQTIFFKNSAVPSGLLVTPQRIDDPLAKMYQTRWETNYAGAQRGRTAVLGNGLEYKQLTQNAVDSQLVAQQNLTALMICATHHVPPFKIGIGEIPNAATAETMNLIYFSDCLQAQKKDIETSLIVGLDLEQKGFSIQLDEDDLIRMDHTARMEFAAKGVEKAIFAPDEARRRFNLPKVTGGASPYLQQQNFSLAALAKRDALPNPFVIDRPTANPTPSGTGPAAVADPNAAKEFTAKVLEYAGASNA